MRSTLLRSTVMFALFTLGPTLASLFPIRAPAAPQATGATTKVPEQKITPPETRYWMGATTAGGMGAMGGSSQQGGGPSMRDTFKMGTGGMPSEHRSVVLQLGSSLASSKPEPEAFHTMPAGAQVSQSIFLQPPASPAGETGEPPPSRQPKGQITFYWG